MESATIFTVTLGLCALSALYFWRVVMRGVQRNILTIPFGVFLCIYFIIAPAANVIFEKYVDESVFTHDPVISLAWLNLLNAGLLLLAAMGARVASRLHAPPNSANPDARPSSGFILTLAALFAASAAYGVYWIYIGEAFIDTPADNSRFLGSILRYMFIESAPLTFCWMVSCIVILQNRSPGHGAAIMLVLAQIAIILCLTTSRGARVSVISTLLFTMQIYTYCIFRIRALHTVIFAVALIAFLQVYANYKYGGKSALENYLSSGSTEESAEYYNDPVRFIIGDLGRADIQAPLLMRYLDGEYTPNGFGESYLSSLALMLPKSMRPESLRPKSQIGAYAQLDVTGTLRDEKAVALNADGYLVSSRIYGLLGEAILNFGLLGAAVAFALYGAVSRLSLLRAVDFRSWDRLLLSPFFAAIPIYLLFYDADNLLVQAITIWGVPGALLFGYRVAFARAR